MTMSDDDGDYNARFFIFFKLARIGFILEGPLLRSRLISFSSLASTWSQVTVCGGEGGRGNKFILHL